MGKVLFLHAQEEDNERELGDYVVLNLPQSSLIMNNLFVGKCTVPIVIALFEP